MGLSDNEQERFDDIVRRLEAEGGIRPARAAAVTARFRRLLSGALPYAAAAAGLVLLVVGITAGLWISFVGTVLIGVGMWAAINWLSAAARRAAENGTSPLRSLAERIPRPHSPDDHERP